MTTIQYSENFILTSPEEQLKQMSFQPTIDNIFIQNPIKLKNKKNIYQFQRWNVSEELKPSQKEKVKIKQVMSTSLTFKKPKLVLNYTRAKTSIHREQAKQMTVSNEYNFKNRKKRNSFFYDSTSKTQRVEYDFKVISPLKHNQQFQLQRSKIKAKIKQQNKIFSQKDRRLLLVQNYLNKQKKKMFLQKQQDSQNEKAGCSFIQYPVRYWENDKNVNNKKSSIMSQNSKTVKNIHHRGTFLINKKSDSNKIDLQTIEIDKTQKNQKNRIFSQKVIKNYKRPYKRFQQFLVALNMC